MKKKNKVYFNCGYEDDCVKKDCLHCNRKVEYNNLSLTQAEETCIEDIAVCDIKSFIETKPEEFELLQNVMKKLMYKIFSKQ